jgi:hypothetical protein
MWESGKSLLLKSDEDLLIERALEVSRKLLGNTNITGLGLLESIIDNPHVYGVKFTRSKSDGEELNEILRLRGIICKAYGNPDPQDYHPLCGTTRDVKPELYSLDKKLRDYYEEGYTHVVIRARGPLCPGAPRRFLGFPEGGYSDGGVKFGGYKIPLSRFIEIFIVRAKATEEKQNDVNAENIVYYREHDTNKTPSSGEKGSQQPNTAAQAAAAADIGKTGIERIERIEAIDTAIDLKDFQSLPSNNRADHSKSLKSDTAINISIPSIRSIPPPPNSAAEQPQQLQPTPSSIGGGVRGFEALKKVIEKIEPGCYPEDELRQKLGELYDVVVGKLGIAKDKKICLGVEG